MYDTKRAEIKAIILKSIEDSDAFSFEGLISGLGGNSRSIADRVVMDLLRKGEIDYKVGSAMYVKVKG